MKDISSISLLPALAGVEVFKTNVQNSRQAQPILTHLQARFPDYEINFDLEDCDRILRVAGEGVDTAIIMALMSAFGHRCEVLE